MSATLAPRHSAPIAGSRIGLGCSRLGSTLGGARGEEARHLLRHALAQGVTLFDTADIYGQGESERLIGAALGADRDRVTIVTKAGQRFTAAQRAVTLVKRPLGMLARALPGLKRGIASRRAASLPRDYSAAHLQRSIEGSLRRLRTDRIDLFLLHSPDAAAIETGEAVGLLEAQRQAGKLGGWGISVDDAAAGRAALRLAGMAGLQIPLTVAAELRPEIAAFTARGGHLLLREIFAGQPSGVGHRQAAIAAALAWPGATALVGTTSIPHLDEALQHAAGRAA
ncbi:aldo/keto reductase [Roseomonas sp. 18066]|uniref:aldo/keto reductase n=1 Tax=Roseomonas sp. 18066 TaxID=2681412 RepID=UPI001357CA13|nr:aldo/keto reductase [Roseomonas sp. 18066]